ncbi:MAG: hypothetical protein Q8K70_10225 [Bacteroidota bacterium]|nr:hypothetical protein [Bacteroidota bacterium]
MNIQIIKHIVDSYTIDQLKAAEEALLNEQKPEIEIEGIDEGEQLTHTLAAIFCKEEMMQNNLNINQAVRLYSQRVRNSIT